MVGTFVAGDPSRSMMVIFVLESDEDPGMTDFQIPCSWLVGIWDLSGADEKRVYPKISAEVRVDLAMLHSTAEGQIVMPCPMKDCKYRASHDPGQEAVVLDVAAVLLDLMSHLFQDHDVHAEVV